jgi:hypothetical protein
MTFRLRATAGVLAVEASRGRASGGLPTGCGLRPQAPALGNRAGILGLFLSRPGNDIRGAWGRASLRPAKPPDLGLGLG